MNGAGILESMEKAPQNLQHIKTLLAPGGQFLVDSSDLFFKPDDELRYEVGRKTVTGNTDRFSLLFQKPSQ